MLSRDTATIRPAHASEAGAIAQLSRLHVEYGLRWRWTPRRVRSAIRDPETVVLVGMRDGEFAGFAIMRFGDEDAHLHLLAVEPEHRRLGVARALVAWLERSCLTAGMREIRLEVRSENLGARRFYERYGFALKGRIDGYYDRREEALVYCKRPGKS